MLDEDLSGQRCLVDGVELDDDYGVLIKPEVDQAAYALNTVDAVSSTPRPNSLVAWLTIRQDDGTYSLVRKMDPSASIVFWDHRGRRVEFAEQWEAWSR